MAFRPVSVSCTCTRSSGCHTWHRMSPPHQAFQMTLGDLVICSLPPSTPCPSVTHVQCHSITRIVTSAVPRLWGRAHSPQGPQQPAGCQRTRGAQETCSVNEWPLPGPGPGGGGRPLLRLSPNHICPFPFLLPDSYFDSGAASGSKIFSVSRQPRGSKCP